MNSKEAPFYIEASRSAGIYNSIYLRLRTFISLFNAPLSILFVKITIIISISIEAYLKKKYTIAKPFLFFKLKVKCAPRN